MTKGIMKKILIIGSGGAGKSTAAKSLHKITRLPLIHLDRYYWKPDWVEPSKKEWEETVRYLCNTPEWIMDGNYGGTLDYRLTFADTILFLHFPRTICLLGVLKRQYLSKRIDVIPGCPERIDFSFINWIWNFNKRRAPTIIKKLEALDNKTVFILKNRKQLKKLLNEMDSGMRL